MSYRVVKAHAPEPGPESDEVLAVAEGTRLRWQRKPTKWSGWLYCEDIAGVHGWVPEAWLKLEGTEAMIDWDYDATELCVDVGAVLEAELIESGWLLASDGGGRRGWVPLGCLQVLT